MTTPPPLAVGQIWHDTHHPERRFRIHSISALHVAVETLTGPGAGRITRIRSDRFGNPSNGYTMVSDLSDHPESDAEIVALAATASHVRNQSLQVAALIHEARNISEIFDYYDFIRRVADIGR